MRPILVPKLNSNDESCILRAWQVKDGDRVSKDTVLASVETSKADVNLESEDEGIIQTGALVGSECKFGSSIGFIFETEQARQEYLSSPHSNVNLAPINLEQLGQLVITRGARELMAHSKITQAQVKALGKSVVQRADVEALLLPGEVAPPSRRSGRLKVAPAPTEGLSRRQQGIAHTVSLSHEQIPDAFLLMRVFCGKAQEGLRAVSKQAGVRLGLTELLVSMLSALKTEFPAFYRNARTPVAGPANVGVTMDVGKGLFIPVVQQAASKSLPELAKTLMEFRLKAQRDSFKEEDLLGGDVSISLNMEADVLISMAIIVPEQTCILSVTPPYDHVSSDKDKDGQLKAQPALNLGLTYDHRFINGYDAAQFMKALKARIESWQGGA